jgi:hypothetical protein
VARTPPAKRCIIRSLIVCSSMSSIAESAEGFTARPFARSSNSFAISLGVVTPSPYFTELSIATLEFLRNDLEWTRV